MAPNDDERLDRLVDLVADRLRHLPPARLAPVADDVRCLLDELAALALAAEARPATTLPTVADRALGDQVAVLGHDIVVALQTRPDERLAVAATAVLDRLRACLPSWHEAGRPRGGAGLEP